MQSKINLIPRIKDIYDKGENIIQFLRSESGSTSNAIEDILISYDFQSGSYIKFAKENSNYNAAYTSKIADVLNSLGNFNTLLEVGVGEATTLANVISKLDTTPSKALGFDISWSRINYGLQYLEEKKITAKLFVADLFNIPLPDNSVDVIYTSHSIEPNGGREKEALMELYRISKKYLVLLEPTDEFATDEGKLRMKKNGYVQNLKAHIGALKYNLTTYTPFDIMANPLNPTGLYIISKEIMSSNQHHEPEYCCPISKGKLTEFQDHFFSAHSLISYPKVKDIPCLCPSYGILTTKHDVSL